MNFEFALAPWEFVLVHILFVQSCPQSLPNALPLCITVDDAAIKFEDVHFEYGDTKTIFRGLDFSVPAGKTVALVGGSGSGFAGLLLHAVRANNLSTYVSIGNRRLFAYCIAFSNLTRVVSVSAARTSEVWMWRVFVEPSRSCRR